MATEIRRILDRFEKALIDQGVVSAEQLNPGIPKDKVADSLLELELIPTPDVLELFEWHNGFSLNASAGGITPRGVRLANLERLVKSYRSEISYPDENRAIGWFPVFARGSGYICIHCSEDGLGRVSLWDPWFGGLKDFHPIPRLTVLLEWWVERLESNQWQWLPPDQGWVDSTRYEDQTEQQRKSCLV
ncbi:MAG: hypothetical protein ACRC0L_05580 [Angustibacter sp.]